MYNMKTGEFTVHQGPLFANFVLADEINRAPAKVQSALSGGHARAADHIGNTTHQMDDLFLVLATQNPSSRRAPTRCPRLRWIASCSRL